MSHTTWMLLACIWVLTFSVIVQTITIVLILRRVAKLEDNAS